jgi:Tol biopolymer transport system component
MAAVIGLALGAVPVAALAQVPPHAKWATIESRHFRVTFAPGLEVLARRAAERAEVAHARLAAELAAVPAGKIDIVLTDYADISNGLATPLPSNRITLYARPPVDHPTLAYFDDWLDLVVTHELAHIFHLDATGRLGRGLRAAFGRVPMAWPVFPALGTPIWSIEGLATYIESRFTGAGRVRGSYHEMVLRTAILEDAFESIDQVSGTSAAWPGGMRSYIYGSLFLEHLSERFGPEAQKRLVASMAGSWLPPPLFFDRIARKATGTPFTELYDDWRRELQARYRDLADSLRAEGVTATERVVEGGYQTLHPRVGPDGRVAYAAADGRRAAATRIVDPRTGAVRTLSRRNGLGPLAWYPDGALLTAQAEFDGPYRVYSDLYRVDDRGEHRLTHRARLSEPDLARDGRQVVAVQGEGGTNRLVIYDLESDSLRPLVHADPGVHWASPRWSPDGARIAASRWESGAYDVVVLDSLGRILHRLTADRALDTSPAWSPDGRWLVFSSDRSGVPNLFAYDLAAEVASEVDGSAAEEEEASAAEVANAAELPAPAAREPPTPQLHQVTNLLTGAFYPDISPDGRWLYFSAYHADGFHIERIPFDPGTWREPAPVREALRLGSSRAGSGTAGDGGTGSAEMKSAGVGSAAVRSAGVRSAGMGRTTGEGGATGPARPYSPLRSLLPRYWLPYGSSSTILGPSFGAATSGVDLVGRHAYSVQAAYNMDERFLEGELSYRYAGLGLPVLEFTAARSWEGALLGFQGAPGARLLQREDELRLSATLRRQRYRSVAELTLGAEGSSRERTLRGADEYLLPGPRDRLVGAVARAGYANYRAQPFSISPEDGVSLTLLGRRRWDLDPFRDGERILDRGYDEVSGQLKLYKALDLPGYAQHVLAARLSGRLRHGPGASAFGIGGATGATIDLGIGTIGSGATLLPVRGFDPDERAGTRAWSGSLEYRFPVAMIGRGAGLFPLFLDRLSGALFLDAGGAYCGTAQRERLVGCVGEDSAVIAAAGAELGLDAALFFSGTTRLRGGVAVPLRGKEGRPQLYLQLGVPF